MIMIKLRKVWRFHNGNQKLQYIDAQYNGKKEKKVFELLEHIKLIITMNFSREKNKQKQKKNKAKAKSNTLQILKFNRNIVETEEQSIPQSHIDDRSLVKPGTDT